MSEDNCETLYSKIDWDCLKKYDENNKRFSMDIILENQDVEHERVIGYNCTYRYGMHCVNFEYNLEKRIWKILPSKSFNGDDRQQILDLLFNDNDQIRALLQSLTLDQQIQFIIKRYDHHFDDLKSLSVDSTTYPEDNRGKYPINELIELKSLTIPEDDDELKQETSIKYLENDVVDYGLHALLNNSRSKFCNLAPPPVAPRRSRQNSACSTQSSVRYASFLPPPSAPVRRRRVIESILLFVQRKKRTFEKIVDLLRGAEAPTMHELGIEFLHIYDGKFNYREGHTFVMPFRKKTWFLTIEQIKYIDCPMGDVGPRSVLILHYKGHYTSVHV